MILLTITQLDRDVVLGKRTAEESKQDKIEILTTLKKLGQQVHFDVMC